MTAQTHEGFEDVWHDCSYITFEITFFPFSVKWDHVPFHVILVFPIRVERDYCIFVTATFYCLIFLPASEGRDCR